MNVEVAPVISMPSIGEFSGAGFVNLAGPLSAPSWGGEVGSLADLGATTPMEGFGAGLVASSFEPIRESPVTNFSWEGFEPMYTNVFPEPAGITEPGEIFDVTPMLMASESGLTLDYAPLEVQPLLGEVQAEEIIYEAPKWTTNIIKEARYWYTDVEQPVVKQAEIIMPSVEPAVSSQIFAVPVSGSKTELEEIVGTQAGSQPNVKGGVFVQPTIITQPKLEVQEVEEVVEDRKLGEKDREEVEVKNSEVASEVKVKFVEAEEISAKRRKAIEATVEEASKTGKFVLPPEFWDSDSPIVGHGEDGTINLTARDIQAILTRYKDPKEAKGALVKTVYDHVPVKESNTGRQVTFKEVGEVKRGENLKKSAVSSAPAEIVVTRTVKKKVEVIKNGEVVKVSENIVNVPAETTLEQLNPALAEVFQKAA